MSGARERSIVLGLDTATPATVAAAVSFGATTAGAERHGAGPAAGGAPSSAARIAIPGPGERPGHTRLLLGLAEEALSAVGAGWADVGRIVVGLGPGTFTGIRVGVATARALALTHGAELVGVATPAALAEAAGGAGGPHAGRAVLVVQDARRRELFLSWFPDGAAGGAEVVPWTVPQAGLADALAALGVQPDVAVGDGALAFRDVLEDAGVAVPDGPGAHAVDGLALIRAAARCPAGAPELVRPLYVRDADAVPTAERR